MGLSRQVDRLLAQWLAEGTLTRQQCESVSSYLRENVQTSLIDGLVAGGVMTEDRCLELVGEALDMPVIDLTDPRPEPDAVRSLSASLLRRLDLLPLFVLNDSIMIAVADPFRPQLSDTLRRSVGMDVELVLGKREAIRKALDLFVPAAPLAETAERLSRSVAETTEADSWRTLVGRGAQGEAPVVALVDQLFSDALGQGASDIHLEPEAGKCVIRYRVDGLLRHIFDLPESAQHGLISRIKVMAGLDIAQRLVPQDGRIHFSVEGHELDLRASTMPTVYGENVVLRLLDSSSLRTELGDLGFAPGMLTSFRRIIGEPYGLVLVTGPTGSGKTTTLYSALSSRVSETVNVMTIEDPVEYRIPGIRQTQVNPGANLTFASALRALLRQDPDIIMVGEIRDLDTARIAIQASLTGHLVFSTLHTNDAPSALGRLVEMGMPGYLVASTVLGILAQRLVRKPCLFCSTEGPISPEARLGLEAAGDSPWPDEAQVRHAVGCARCRYTGYLGRGGLYELLVPSAAVRRIMSAGGTSAAIREAAVGEGMVTLRSDGLVKARDQFTTVEEVLRVCC